MAAVEEKTQMFDSPIKTPQNTSTDPLSPMSTPVNTTDIIPHLTAYLTNTVPSILNCTPTQFQAEVELPEHQSVLHTYLADSATYTLVIHKCHPNPTDTTSTTPPHFTFDTQYRTTKDSVSAVVVLKQSHTIDPTSTTTPLTKQFHLIQISDISIYHTILSLIKYLFLPYNKTVLQAAHDRTQLQIDTQALSPSKRAAVDDTAIPNNNVDTNVYTSIQRKLNELTVDLNKFSDDTDIPFITLDLHPYIDAYVRKQNSTNKQLNVDDLDNTPADTLHEIQQRLTEWKRDIMSVTQRKSELRTHSVSYEVMWWQTKDRAIEHIKKQRDSKPVELTFQLLIRNNRVFATTSFGADSGLNRQDKVHETAKWLTEFQFKSVLTATTFIELQRAIQISFNNYKKLRTIEYPLNRAVQLMHVFSTDVCKQMVTILNSRKLMTCAYDEFVGITTESNDVITTWNACVSQFIDLIRTYNKTKNEQLEGLLAPQADIKGIEQRIDVLVRLRKEHHELYTTIDTTFQHDQFQRQRILQQINGAYGAVNNVDVLSVTDDGTDLFNGALNTYKQQIDVVECELEDRIRQLLTAASAHGSAEMFRVCAQFNALFVRPRIQSAIREYQDQLMTTVKSDIQALHTKFDQKYSRSEARRMSKLHDIPAVSGSIIWCRQIERQLDSYATRIESVLGKQWYMNIQGQPLKRDIDDFKLKLNPQKLFQAWLIDKQEQSSQLQLKGPLLRVITNSKTNVLSLSVNFDKRLISFFKEAIQLKRLGMKLPWELTSLADEAYTNYPYAMRLDESLRTYGAVCAKMDADKQLSLLGSKLKYNLQQTIMSGIGLQWLDAKVGAHVTALGTQALDFSDQIDDLTVYTNKANALIAKLSACKPTPTACRAIVTELQQIVYYFDKRQCSNVPEYVTYLNTCVETALANKLTAMCKYFADAINTATTTSTHHAVSKDNTDDTMTATDFAVNDLVQLDLVVRSHTIRVEPSLPQARAELIQRFDALIATVIDLPRLFAPSVVDGQSSTNYRSVISKVTADTLTAVYATIETHITSASAFTDSWQKYSTLWSADIDTISAQLGSSVALWERLLSDLRKSRAQVDTTQSTQQFGPLRLDYSNAQQKINSQYDVWYKQILSKLGGMLHDSNTQLHTSLAQARGQLEKHVFDMANVNDIIDSVTLIQSLHNTSTHWAEQLNNAANCEKVLTRNRYAFAPEWLYAERLIGEHGAFKQILDRKLNKLAAEDAVIRRTVNEHAAGIEQRITDVVAEWKQVRPTDGQAGSANNVEAVLSEFEVKLNRLNDDIAKLAIAKQALSMPASAASDNRLISVADELKSLQDVWSALGTVYGQLTQLQSTPFRSIPPSDVRQRLSAIQSDAQQLPIHVRQYGAYQQLVSSLRDYLAVNAVLMDLSSPTIRPKHEKQILKLLGLTSHATLADVILRDLWATNLTHHTAAIRAIVDTSQGESAIETFITELKNKYDALKYDLKEYKSKVFVVSNWSALFASIAEWQTDVSAMKLSPFYNAFSADGTHWEATLNTQQALFDVFVDVQRRYVYLDGIFANNADIQQQLPVQFKQYRLLDRDYIRLMRDVHSEPSVDAWLQSERGLMTALQTHSETLSVIQSALTSYLNKQRQFFTRFYFVGDDDLLDIVGNSDKPVLLQKYMQKMFAGLHNLVVSADSKSIVGVASKEGESLTFIEPVSLVQHSAVTAWLTQVQLQVKQTLMTLVRQAVQSITQAVQSNNAYINWIDQYPAQVVLLATHVHLSTSVESAITNQSLQSVLDGVEGSLRILAERILQPTAQPVARLKYEQLITDLVHHRDVIRSLIDSKATSVSAFTWQKQLRYYLTDTTLVCRISRAQFEYGFEYNGVAEKLVQTPLTDTAYLTLAESLHMRLGGNPFGPAGTGKTETVKALASALGRHCVVFNCDDNFDLNAMTRIFIGLCQSGSWGCFDEFNRLTERILSAVSQQILTIQSSLRQQVDTIQLNEQTVPLNKNLGLFVTLNPGYAGRSNLPDNLKSLFRPIAMIQPNNVLIGQVVLYSQGFVHAERLSGQITALFDLCSDQLSKQTHYDFGLRALKSVLRSAGELKRATHQIQLGDEASTPADSVDVRGEEDVLLRSVAATVVPKLVYNDELLFVSLVKSVFVNTTMTAPSVESIRQATVAVCKQQHYQCTQPFVDKLMQLHEIMALHHGIILVGDTCTGKSAVLHTLKSAVEQVSKQTVKVYTIDPKSLSKVDLFGVLDNTTLVWTDGVLTHILRSILLDLRNESQQAHWIVLDGDVDPEWAENLNSVLDDNKLLTLPNGERLQLPHNVKIVLECASLQYATPATVSRCGMVYFSSDVVTTDMLLHHAAGTLRHQPMHHIALKQSIMTRWSNIQAAVADAVDTYLLPADGKQAFMSSALKHALPLSHVMSFNAAQCVTAMTSMLNAATVRIMEYNDAHTDFPYTAEQVKEYIQRYILYTALWACAGSLNLNDRVRFANFLVDACKTKSALPSARTDETVGQALLDSYVDIDTQQWAHWSERVSQVELEPSHILRSDLVIDTIDTARHTDVISCYASTLRPFILCGPPGSGKSMTLAAVFKSLNEFELVTLNFSSTTAPDLLLQTLAQHCRLDKTAHGASYTPTQPNKHLVIFCDEINLPSTDKYATQHVITFIRQCIQHGGYWRAADQLFIRLEHITIIGACNPPTDAGRVDLTPRLLRHCPVVFVDFPSVTSLHHIYSTFNRALLKLAPVLRNTANQLTSAMIDVYTASQQQFTTDNQPHYVYSPRELSRWCRAMYEAIQPLASNSMAFTGNDMVRLWAHEALRLFSDRLVTPAERDWTSQLIDTVANKQFAAIANVNLATALQRPILFSHYLSKSYVSVDADALRTNIQSRLKVFYEEQMNVPIVLFDDVLAHILRIDRVLQQPIGHMLLVGASGAGKTMLSRFVAWMNGMSTFQIKMHGKYGADDFIADLQSVVIRAGVHHEPIVFIFDESNVISTAFLELMNSLLAGGDIPGLFTGTQYTNLLNDVKATAKRNNMTCHTDDDLYRYFVRSVQKYLHVVFTMNPANNDFANRCHTSPALYNRCVIDWFGEWSSHALTQVGCELLSNMDLTIARRPHDNAPLQTVDVRNDLVNALVQIHGCVQQQMNHVAAQTGVQYYVTPRHYLDVLAQFTRLHGIKRDELVKHQVQLNTGIQQLDSTEQSISQMQIQLTANEAILSQKQADASAALEQIVANKSNAEAQTVELNGVSQQIATQEVEIKAKQASVSEQLSQVLPLIEAAKQSVENIKKTDLDLVCRFPNPPISVKLTLQAVLMILSNGKNVDLEWGECTKLLRKADFIKSVLTYDFADLTDKIRNKINDKYLSAPETQYDAVYNASQACAPLIQWVRSSIKYSEIVENVKPLKAETAKLESASSALTAKKAELEQQQVELNKLIETLKTDFSALINQTEIIKNDIAVNKAKIDKSVQLIKNLTVESVRWRADVQNYKAVETNLIGNVAFCAAFTIYAGQFTEVLRGQLYSQWQQLLTHHHVDYDAGISASAYLARNMSHPIQWRNDDNADNHLYNENFVLLNNYKRFPLVVDETNTIVQQLVQKHGATQKIVRTQFEDVNFLKTLELSIRFGNVLIIDNIEANLDSVLNSVLNQEFSSNKNSVEKTIEIGGKSVTYINTFQLYLFSSNPSVVYSADLASRVTLVNFSVNQFTVYQRVNNTIFATENAAQHGEKQMLALQQVELTDKVQALKDDLLVNLSEKTNILENDRAFNNIQSVQRQTDECIEKLAQSGELLRNINTYASQYSEFSQTVSRVYMLITKLKQINPLYQFSYAHFIDTLTVSFGRTHAECAVEDVTGRLRVYLKNLVVDVYSSINHSLLQADLYALFYRVAELYAQFAKLDVKAVQQYTSNSVQQYISTVFTDQQINLSAIEPIDLQHTSQTTVYPLLLVTSSGTDPLVQLAAQSGSVTRFALGTTTVAEHALAAVLSAVQQGGTIVLQNIHMATSDWLSQLNKVLRSNGNKHKQFRLLCSVEYRYVNALPVPLIEQCKVLVYEPATGLHSTVTRLLHTLPADRFNHLPAERPRLYMLAIWLHAVLLERLRYTPLGWSKLFEFSDVDIRLCIDVIDDVIDAAAQGKANIAPQRIPYDTIQQLLQNVVYGGRLDNVYDSSTLRTLLQSLFCVAAYDHDFPLASSVDSTGKTVSLLTSPDVVTYDSVVQWIDSKLTAGVTPEYTGLPANADQLLSAQHAHQIQKQVHLLQADEQSDDAVDVGDIALVEAGAGEVTSKRPEYVLAIGRLATDWLGKLPAEQDILQNSVSYQLEHNVTSQSADQLAQLNDNPMFRAVQREMQRYGTLAGVVRADLTLLQQYANNTVRSSNHVRDLLAALQSQTVPHAWHRHLVDGSATTSQLTVIQWLTDLHKRVQHVASLAKLQPDKCTTTSIWLGALIAPQAFLSATRRSAAIRAGVADVTALQLNMSPADEVGGSAEDDTYYISHTELHGATFNQNRQLSLLTDKLSVLQPLIKLTWTKRTAADAHITLPVYGSSTRSSVLFSVCAASGGQANVVQLYTQRAVALTLWNQADTQ